MAETDADTRRAPEALGEVPLEPGLQGRNGPGALRAWTGEMQAALDHRHVLLDEIAEALDTGAIRPWFQPQISTDTGRITGFEALARWIHPDRGVIPPGEFLPLINAAREVILMADSSKFGRKSPNIVCSLESVDKLITDAGIDPAFKKALEEKGIDVIVTGERDE